MPGRLWRTRCPACQGVLETPKGGCCVYCAHGDTPCPEAQRAGSCSCAGEG